MSAESNIDECMRTVGGSAKQVPFAAALALTRTAKLAQQAEVREMRDVFARPTPWTLGGVGVKPATKQDLEAIVFLKDARATSDGGTAPDKYLSPEISGGFRRNKAFEIALQRIGALPPDWVVVPGAACKLDAYGNIPRGLIVQILSYFRTFDTAGFSANITDQRKAKLKRGSKRTPGFEYFVGRPGDGKLPLGIWQRFSFGHGSSIRPIFIFVDGASYQKRFEFGYVAQLTFNREYDAQFAQAFGEAQASAR